MWHLGHLHSTLSYVHETALRGRRRCERSLAVCKKLAPRWRGDMGEKSRGGSCPNLLKNCLSVRLTNDTCDLTIHQDARDSPDPTAHRLQASPPWVGSMDLHGPEISRICFSSEISRFWCEGTRLGQKFRAFASSANKAVLTCGPRPVAGRPSRRTHVPTAVSKGGLTTVTTRRKLI